jgi:phosphotransferase system enzyme I (PtsP)
VPPRKDNVEMICSIGEIAGLFERSSSLQNFLQTAVSIIAYHMRAAVCSVYLLEDETQTLVLTANQGLSADSVGRVRLKLGEGLVGTALKELRPIREAMASRNPLFKFVPGIHEERYQAFLAVPIIRGTARVGVIAVQDPVIDYFDDNDTRALQAIASQLATVIENAKLLMSLHERETPAQPVALDELRFQRGIAVSGGIATGTALRMGNLEAAWLMDGFDGHMLTAEDLRRALRDSEHQLEELQRTMDEGLADVASLIFSAHLLIIKDEQFAGRMLSLVDEGTPAMEAVSRVAGDYTRIFQKSANPRVREKVQDVQDLAQRILHNLHRQPESAVDYRGQVVVASDMLPSDMIKLAVEKVEGLLLVGGGVTSHVSILARSLQIPVVVVERREFLTLPAGSTLLLDGDQGTVYVNPDPDVLKKYEDLREARVQLVGLKAPASPEAVSRDGQAVQVYANVNLLSEAQTAHDMNAGGVGLYRTEFPFIVRNDFPSEEEQYLIYRRLLDLLPEKPITFRTLDVGGDKVLSYFPTAVGSNPFLGLRAIRFLLRNRDIFAQQLRALLRAGAGRPLRIMFPMISSVDDFLEAREVVTACLVELQREKIPHQARPQLGVMVEMPSAVEVVDELAAEADFLSIGSNDLVQYILAVDRTNENISDLYVPHHPAVLRSLNRIVQAAGRHGKPLSLCGEIASDERLLPFLLGIGLRTVSVEVRQIPRVHELVAGLDLGREKTRASRVLKMGRIRDVEAALAR